MGIGERLNMVIGSSKKYTISELESLSDNELLSLLKRSWGYTDNNSLKVIGVVQKIQTAESEFFVLTDIKNKDLLPIKYPLEGEVYETIFIGSTLKTGIKEGDLVIAEGELSPPYEREKHLNPLEVNVIQRTIEKLIKVVDVVDNIIHESHVENWVIQEITKNKTQEVNKIIEKEKKKHHKLIEEENKNHLKLIEKNKKISSELEKLSKREQKFSALISKQREQVAQAKKKVADIQQDVFISKKTLENSKKIRQAILSKLNGFIEEKSKVLLELGILDQETLKAMTSSIEERAEVENGYKHDDFNNISEIVSHVQAYLFDKGIMYRRNVLENFFTLLSTRDLIVLAGDSGSGKTNLVKSFADAIGGKSFIIPVKPNWTGSEDLLGYYNPIEQSYLSTPFLDAILEAESNPDVPYLICLDEMNLARVEYYFADFLSLLEERSEAPKIPLYSKTESSHLVSEAKNFLSLINETKRSLNKQDIESFVEILQDEELNRKLHDLCGFKDGDSLLKYHTRLRKAFDSYLNNPSELALPDNVFFIGAINVDETTHYLSPKILDRAHVVRFVNPLLQDWAKIESEVEQHRGTGVDTSKKVFLSIDNFSTRQAYPNFDSQAPLTQQLVEITKEYLMPLGVEFGLRTIRQAQNYSDIYQNNFNDIPEEYVLNNIVMQKILPKLMFDGEKTVDGERKKSDVLELLSVYVKRALGELDINNHDDAREELVNTINLAKSNDWIVNYWSR